MFIVQIATGKAHTLFLTNEGRVLAVGANNCGQCGVGKGQDKLLKPKIISYMGPDIMDVSSLTRLHYLWFSYKSSF